jgi:polygalacturonase
MMRMLSTIILLLMMTCLSLGGDKAIDSTERVTMSVIEDTSIYNVLRFGANGDGEFDNTDAFADAIDTCAGAGGGTVYFPAGTYLTSPIFLKSKVTLYLEAGATILGTTDWYAYPVINSRMEGVERECYASLIQASDCENVALVGRGTVDGQGEIWWGLWKKKYRSLHREYEAKGITEPIPGKEDEWEIARIGSCARPRLVEFLRCRNVFVEGVTLKDSPSWTLHPVYCDNVTIQGITVRAPEHSGNTDACNPDSCRNVRISNCQFDVGDDCIAIKSGRDEDGRRVGRPSEFITITNCTMYHGHGGVVIGSEMSGGVRDVAISNCVFNGTHRGIRLKTMRGRGGIVENISVSNIVMRDVPSPFVFNMEYRHTEPEAFSERTPTFRSIHISNVVATGGGTAMYFRGLEENPIQNVTFSNVRIEAKEGAVAHNVDGLEFHNVRIDTDRKRALVCDNVRNLELDRFTTGKPWPDTPVAFFHQLENAFIHGCFAPEGTGTFLRFEGENTRNVVLLGNHIRHATQPISWGEGISRDAISED